MKNIMSHFGRQLFILLVIVVLGLLARNWTYAYSPSPSIEAPNNIPGLNQVIQNPPGPVSEFINSVKQINQNLTYKTSRFNFNTFNPTNIWEEIDAWFRKVIGISLSQIIRAIGNFILWILSFVGDVIRWVLSLLR